MSDDTRDARRPGAGLPDGAADERVEALARAHEAALVERDKDIAAVCATLSDTRTAAQQAAQALARCIRTMTGEEIHNNPSSVAQAVDALTALAAVGVRP